jgi:hypothetical protein
MPLAIQISVQTMTRVYKQQEVEERVTATETLYARAMELQGGSNDLFI